MAIPQVTLDVAKNIYYYAGDDGIPAWDDLSPTIQISFVEEAEAALEGVCGYIRFLADQVDVQDDDSYLVRGTMVALATSLDPSSEKIT
jgi:hypothetical protein